jgi:uncharacterized protein (TIGR02391 family)
MSVLAAFPPLEEIIGMEPEELGPFLLRYLKTQPEASINRYNFTMLNDHEIFEKLGNDQNKLKALRERMMEAWMWLEREGLVLPQPGQKDDWSFITQKGKRLLAEENFEAYKKANLFPVEIDPVLVREVRPLFVRGDYDTAVFRAFKEVEVRVRKKGNFSNDDYGVDLMRKAFGANGPLTNKTATKGEQDAVRELFSGALGTFKNPSSHREVKYDDPKEVADAISIANQLLRMVERI